MGSFFSNIAVTLNCTEEHLGQHEPQGFCAHGHCGFVCSGGDEDEEDFIDDDEDEEDAGPVKSEYGFDEEWNCQ